MSLEGSIENGGYPELAFFPFALVMYTRLTGRGFHDPS
jgi:hypothetical protein